LSFFQVKVFWPVIFLRLYFLLFCLGEKCTELCPLSIWCSFHWGTF
jgi:hypothetical protein